MNTGDLAKPYALHDDTTIVIIDDNPDHLNLLRASLHSGSRGLGRVLVQTHEDPAEAIGSLPVDGRVAVLCDYRLKTNTGLDWIPDLKRASVGPVILVTSMADEDVVADAFRMGAADYISKSEAIKNPARLQATITEAMRRFDLEQSNRYLNRRLKISNRELRHKTERLAEITQNAHRFVEDVAHEFRTPLAVVQEFASILSDGIGGQVTPKQGEYLSFIHTAARDLAHLVDDFLDISKLRARTLRIDRKEQDIAELLAQCRPMLEARATARGVVVEQQIDDGLPPVYADGEKIRRTLVNLVINAVKFSSLGKVVRITVTREGQAIVRISVSDQGRGMPKDQVAGIFQRFRQGRSDDREGFGLGLSIVADLVSLNLGELGIESKEGFGSTFSFTLPVNSPDHILEAFLSHVSSRWPDLPVQGMMVTRDHGRLDVRALQVYLATMCHAQDLQMPLPDKNAVLLIGATLEPNGWRNRLLRMDKEGRSVTRREIEGHLSVEHVGTWDVEHARAEVPRLLASQEAQAHAVQRTDHR